MTKIRQTVLAAFEIPAKAYSVNQVRYDVRKMIAHGLIKRQAGRYAYRLTEKGVKVAILFILFHKRLCGPPANSLFHHKPNGDFIPDSRIENAYHKADEQIQKLVCLLEAA